MKNKHLGPKIYKSTDKNSKGSILYFHGGGLFFGSKYDLPKYHIDKITEAGYNILSFNYPLAPESKFPAIIKDVIDNINLYTENINQPYFLWGRSAGAYLCLLSASKGLNIKPNGIISYYGYGILVPHWYSTPSLDYLKYPLVEKHEVERLIEKDIIVSSPVNPRFLIYLYSRQKGNWVDLIWDKSEKEFLEEYSLAKTDFTNYPPVFLAHNTKDNDVPYEETIELSKRINHFKLFTCTTEDHDFDRNIDDINTTDLIKETIEFLNRNI
jgi:acetyl esterase/lipase